MKHLKVKQKKPVTWMVLSIVSFSLVVAMSVGLIVQNSQSNALGTSLEMVYERSFYELVENVNSLDTKLEKILASSSAEMQKKILKEAATNSSFAEQNLSIMPIRGDDMEDIHRFFNQIAGYSEYIGTTISTNGITTEQRQTINKIQELVSEIKGKLNQISLEMQKGFQIVKNLNEMKTNTDAFSTILGEMKGQDIEFPTMIFDGPFSEATLGKTPKGLPENKVTADEAKLNVIALLNLQQPFLIESLGKTEGKFTTFNFRVEKDGQTNYLGITENGGKLLTISGHSAGTSRNFSLDDAKKVALEFAIKNGIESPEVVWNDEIEGDIYFNIAPVKNKIIYYPDLVKIKVDLQTNKIIGYEASSYYINHVSRNLGSASYDVGAAKSKIQSGYIVKTSKICLAPISFGEEILCYEFSAEKNGQIYYFYINAITGKEELILKVVNSNGGNLLS